MAQNCTIVGFPPSGEVDPEQLALLREHIAPRLSDLEWAGEGIAMPELANANDRVSLPAIGQEGDAEGQWKDVLQVTAVAILASQILPDWLWNVREDGELLEERLSSGELWLYGGVVHDVPGGTKAPFKAPPTENDTLHQALRPELMEALSAEGVAALLTWNPPRVEEVNGPEKLPPAEPETPPIVRFVRERGMATDRPSIAALTLTHEGALTVRLHAHIAARQVVLAVVLRGEGGVVLGQVEATTLQLEAREVRVLELGCEGLPLDEVVQVECFVRLDRAKPSPAAISQQWVQGEGHRRLDFFVDHTHGRDADGFELRVQLWDDAATERVEPIQLESTAEALGAGPQVLGFSLTLDDASFEWVRTAGATLLAVTRTWFSAGAFGRGGFPVDALRPPVMAARAPKPRLDGQLDFTDTETLLLVLDSDDPRLLVRACESVSFLALHAATTAVRALLSHSDASVRVEATRALGVIGGIELIGVLEAMLDDRDAAVRKAASRAVDAITSR